MTASTFTQAHLGKWEQLYRDLLEGESLPLTPEGIWMLGDKPGMIAVFEDDEPVHISGTTNIAKNLQTYIKGGAVSGFRTLVAILDLGASQKTAEQRAKSGPLAERVDKRVAKMRYRVVPAPTQLLDTLAAAFTVVADPRYSGPTALANRAIDALPQ